MYVEGSNSIHVRRGRPQALSQTEAEVSRTCLHRQNICHNHLYLSHMHHDDASTSQFLKSFTGVEEAIYFCPETATTVTKPIANTRKHICQRSEISWPVSISCILSSRHICMSAQSATLKCMARHMFGCKWSTCGTSRHDQRAIYMHKATMKGSRTNQNNMIGSSTTCGNRLPHLACRKLWTKRTVLGKIRRCAIQPRTCSFLGS